MLAAASSLATCHNPYFDDKYLDWFLLLANWHANVESKRQALDSTNAILDKRPSAVVRRMKGMSCQRDDSTPHDCTIYQDLIMFATPSEKCTQ